MLFNSFAFLLFFPIFLLGYFLSSGRVRLWWMLAASLLFYGWWDWRYVILMVGVVACNWWLALRIGATAAPLRRKVFVTAACIINLGTLAFFKYLDFFITSVHAGFARLGVEVPIHALGIVLPVGISFYVFHAMSYTIDVYRRELEPDPDPVRVLTFVAFFPQLVAGPIVRGTELLPQVRNDRRPTWESIQSGIGMILVGYFKKTVVADTSAVIVNHVFENPGLFSPVNVLIGVYLYAMQIYCDFSGYSDIALGIGRIMGFVLPENFRMPYFSASFSEFWTRWHITLSRWLRDYLYIPLGGGRAGRARTFLNLFITMLLGGLWHGASWTFVFWGFLHGLYLVLQRLLGPAFHAVTARLHVPKPLTRLFLVLLVFHLTCMAWVFFRAPDFGRAVDVLGAIFSRGDWNPLHIRTLQDTTRAVGAACLLIGCELAWINLPLAAFLRRHPVVRLILYAVIIEACVLLGNFIGQQFIYFQF